MPKVVTVREIPCCASCHGNSKERSPSSRAAIVEKALRPLGASSPRAPTSSSPGADRLISTTLCGKSERTSRAFKATCRIWTISTDSLRSCESKSPSQCRLRQRRMGRVRILCLLLRGPFRQDIRHQCQRRRVYCSKSAAATFGRQLGHSERLDFRFIGQPAFSAYAATKASVRSFARTWSVDLKNRGIRVNAISPGYILTPAPHARLGITTEMHENVSKEIPLGRVGSADEVAKAVVFLASDDSSYITGIDLCVDGGGCPNLNDKIVGMGTTVVRLAHSNPKLNVKIVSVYAKSGPHPGFALRANDASSAASLSW